MKLASPNFQKVLDEAEKYTDAKYSLQYKDYDKNTWTAPVRLNKARAEYIVQDNSVRAIKLIYLGGEEELIKN